MPTLFGVKSSLMEMKSAQRLLHCKPLLQDIHEGFDSRSGAMMNPNDVRSIPL